MLHTLHAAALARGADAPPPPRPPLPILSVLVRGWVHKSSSTHSSGWLHSLHSPAPRPPSSSSRQAYHPTRPTPLLLPPPCTCASVLLQWLVAQDAPAHLSCRSGWLHRTHSSSSGFFFSLAALDASSLDATPSCTGVRCKLWGRGAWVEEQRRRGGARREVGRRKGGKGGCAGLL